MTRMTRPDCAVMCNLINIHTYIHTYMHACIHSYSANRVLVQVYAFSTRCSLELLVKTTPNYFPGVQVDRVAVLKDYPQLIS